MVTTVVTSSATAARQLVTAITAQLEGYRQHLRLRDGPIPGAHLLRAANDEQSNDGSLRFSEATDLYLRLKGQGKAETFHRAATRACRYLTEVAGDKPLSGYVRADAAKLRDSLVKSGLAGSSVSRLFTTVKSIFNAVECPKDIVDQIGGWASISVGEAYGDGYPLEVLSK